MKPLGEAGGKYWAAWVYCSKHWNTKLNSTWNVPYVFKIYVGKPLCPLNENLTSWKCCVFWEDDECSLKPVSLWLSLWTEWLRFQGTRVWALRRILESTEPIQVILRMTKINAGRQRVRMLSSPGGSKLFLSRARQTPTRLCHCCVKGNTSTNECGCVPIKLLFTKTGGIPVLAYGPYFLRSWSGLHSWIMWEPGHPQLPGPALLIDSLTNT